MAKDDYKNKIAVLINRGNGFFPRSDGAFLDKKQILQCQEWFSDIINFIKSFASEKSFYLKETERIIKQSKRVGGICWNEIEMMKGHLKSISKTIDVKGIEQEFREKDEELEKEAKLLDSLQLTPNIGGIGINLKKAWRWFINKFRIKKQYKMEKRKKRIWYYLEAWGTLFFIPLIVIIIIQVFHPRGYYIKWEETIKKFIEQKTGLSLDKDPQKKYYVSQKTGIYLATSYFNIYGLKEAILPQNVPIVIKSPYNLRVGLANLGIKTLEDPELTLVFSEGITVEDKRVWTEFEPNTQYFVKLGNINPKVLMNISPMKISLKEPNIPYEVRYIITGKDVQNPVNGKIILLRTE